MAKRIGRNEGLLAAIRVQPRGGVPEDGGGAMKGRVMGQIIPIHEVGVMRVYRREQIQRGEKRYMVLRTTDDHFLEEFRQKRSAVSWALKNQAG